MEKLFIVIPKLSSISVMRSTSFFPTRLAFPQPVFRYYQRILIKGELTLFNSTGQLVKVQRLTSPNETVSMERLQKGVYILHIQQEGKKEFTSKIILQ